MKRITADPLPPAVVLGLSPTGLHVVRTLARAGIKVFGVGRGIQAGMASRYLACCIRESDPIAKIEMLCKLFPEDSAGQTQRPVLIPTADVEVDLIINHSARLARHFSFQASYSDSTARTVLSKDSFYKLCASHRVHFPSLIEFCRDRLAEVPDILEFPVMIKPARLHEIKSQMRGKKGWIARNKAELLRVVSLIPDDAGNLLVQEIIPGPESSITLFCAHFDAHGQVRQPFTARKLRQYPPGFGSASLVQSIPEVESADIASAMLLGAGYRGIAAAEFKRHSRTGRLAMIEINVRPSLWFSLTDAAGKSVVLSAYRELAGFVDPLPELAQVNGIRWRYAPKDALSARFYRRNPDFILPSPDIESAGPKAQSISAVFSATDPAPAALDAVNLGAKFVSRLRLFTTKRS